MFATIGHEPFMYGTLTLAFSSDIFFCRMLFIGDLTELPIPMNHYVVDEKKLKTNSLGFGCRMIFSKSHASYWQCSQKQQYFFIDEDQVPIETFISPKHHNSIVAKNEKFFSGEGRIQTNFFLSSKHHNSTVARHRNIYFFQRGSSLIEFFLSSMHRSNSVARNENIFFVYG